MDTDLQPIAEQPRLTCKVNAFAEVCISVYLRQSVVSLFQLPFLGSPCFQPSRLRVFAVHLQRVNAAQSAIKAC